MKSLKDNQQGLGFVLVLGLLVVVGLVALVGLRIMHQDTALSSTVVAPSSPVPAKFKNQSDVQKASQALDSTATDTGATADQLDSDLSSLL